MAPSECAQSSITFRLARRAIATIGSMSHDMPYRWVGSTALVFAVMARSTALGSSVKVVGSMSANTGFRPATRTISGTTQKVNAGTTTSLPAGSCSAWRMK